MNKRTVWIIAAVLAACALLYAMRGALALLFSLLLVAVTLAYCVAPLQRRLERYTTPGRAALVSIAGVMICAAGALLLIIPPVVRQATELSARLPTILHRVEVWLGDVGDALIAAGVPEGVLSGIDRSMEDIAPRITAYIQDAMLKLGGLVVAVGQYALTPVLAFYLLRDRRRVLDVFLRLAPAGARPMIVRMGSAAHKALGRYVKGQIIVTLSTGATTAIGLCICGMPSFMVMGVIMSLFNLIPYVGPLLGAIPIAVFAAAEGVPMLIKALAVVVAAQQLESIFITPKVMSGVANVHPIAVILLLVGAGTLLGLPGLIFCIPAYMMARCILEEWIRARSSAPG